MFIYSVKINVALRSIPSGDASTLTGLSSSSINAFHPNFSMILLFSPVVQTSFSPREIDGCDSLLSSIRHLTRPTVSLETPTLLSGFVFLVSITCSFFSKARGRNLRPPVGKRLHLSSLWQLICAGLHRFLGAAALTLRPISFANMSPCCSSYLDLLLVCFLAGSLNDGL